MWCSICKQNLPVVNHDYIWRTVGMSDVKPKQWAKLPVHKECKEATEQEMMKCKILIAADIPAYEYSFTEPKGNRDFIDPDDKQFI